MHTQLKVIIDNNTFLKADLMFFVMDYMKLKIVCLLAVVQITKHKRRITTNVI